MGNTLGCVSGREPRRAEWRLAPTQPHVDRIVPVPVIVPLPLPLPVPVNVPVPVIVPLPLPLPVPVNVPVPGNAASVAVAWRR